MLSYAAQDTAAGEILMTYGGPTLDNWIAKIPSKEMRRDFLMTMLRQVTHGLKLLHSFGYSHGDLKG